jgi:DNA-directed RNA polymerase subunit N (RpoN/RPB10)
MEDRPLSPEPYYNIKGVILIVKCKNCHTEFDKLSYQIKKSPNHFCSNSCSASFNNVGVRRHGKSPGKCINCGKTISKHTKKYCSNKCSSDHTYKQYIERWKDGKESGSHSNGFKVSRYVRRYLLEKYNNKCSRCGWDKENPFVGAVILEVEHIDGDCTNNREKNLDLICPNCHSLTSTYKSLNKGNGNRSRLVYYKLK